MNVYECSLIKCLNEETRIHGDIDLFNAVLTEVLVNIVSGKIDQTNVVCATD